MSHEFLHSGVDFVAPREKPDTGVPSGGGNQDTSINTIIMPSSSDALAAALNERGISVIGEMGSNSWRKRAEGALAQSIRRSGGTIMSERPRNLTEQGAASETHQPINPYEIQTLTGMAGAIEREQKNLQVAFAESPAIEEARVSNMGNLVIPDDGPVTIAAEVCPLYLPGSLPESRVDTNPQGLESILASRVGNKWKATTHALATLNNLVRKEGRQLAVEARFGDVGVIAATPEDVREDALEAQSRLYEDMLGEFCYEQGINFSFGNLSEMQPPQNERHRADRFIVVKDGEVGPENPSIDELKELLDLPRIPLNNRPERKDAEILLHAYKNLGGHIKLWRGFANTYLHHLRDSRDGSHMQLGMERADWILGLQGIKRTPDEVLKTAVNVKVA